MKLAVAASLAALASTVAVAAPLECRAHTGARGTWFNQDGNAGSCGTWFNQDGNAGSCGTVRSDSDYIVAVSSQHHDASFCGKTITISANGVTKEATIADTCPTCDTYDLDMSTRLFSSFADLSVGTLTIDWYANW